MDGVEICTETCSFLSFIAGLNFESIALFMSKAQYKQKISFRIDGGKQNEKSEDKKMRNFETHKVQAAAILRHLSRLGHPLRKKIWNSGL